MEEDVGVKRLHETSYAEQYRRQRISDGWTPRGFKRYGYQAALLEGMPVLGGPNDNLGYNPERYHPTTNCAETLDCQCGRGN